MSALIGAHYFFTSNLKKSNMSALHHHQIDIILLYFVATLMCLSVLVMFIFSIREFVQERKQKNVIPELKRTYKKTVILSSNI